MERGGSGLVVRVCALETAAESVCVCVCDIFTTHVVGVVSVPLHQGEVTQSQGNMISIHCKAEALSLLPKLSLPLSSFQLLPLGKKNQVCSVRSC